MAGEILSTTTSTDQEKFLAADLIRRSYLKLVMGALCDKVQMKKGAGLTANFVRYKRMGVPLSVITEGNDPANSSFTLDSVTVTMDQWGDIITITDVAQLTTLHPLVQQCVELLADNAARVMDREITLVLLAGTNVIYGDGSVASRTTITTAMKVSDTLLGKARVTMVNNGAPPKGGPAGDAKQVAANGTFTQGQSYVAVCGPEVMEDVTATSTSLGTWASVAMYANQKALYNTEVGTWRNFRFVETNFIPRFSILGNTTTAVVTANAFGTNTPTVTANATGGTFPAATGYFFKVTRIDSLRGFEEEVSIEHTMTSAGGAGVNSFTFDFSALTTGFYYRVYFGSATGNANLKLASFTINGVSTTYVPAGASAAATVVTAVPGSTVTAPVNTNPTGTPTIQPVFIFAQAAVNWVGFYNIEMRITGDQPIIGNVLGLKKALGYKFFGKSMIRDQTRLLRLEVASTN
jgi:N4-gp56 family major capsid protein